MFDRLKNFDVLCGTNFNYSFFGSTIFVPVTCHRTEVYLKKGEQKNSFKVFKRKLCTSDTI